MPAQICKEVSFIAWDIALSLTLNFCFFFSKDTFFFLIFSFDLIPARFSLEL